MEMVCLLASQASIKQDACQNTSNNNNNMDSYSIFLSCSITCTIIQSQCKVISECFSVECKYEVNKNDAQHSHIMSSKAFKQKFSLSHLFHYYHHSTLQPFGITLAAIPPLHAPSPTPFLLPAMVHYSN